MVKTYIINLDHEKDKFNKVNDLLKDKNFININRFSGIYGKTIVDFQPYQIYLCYFFKYYAPRGALGTALSHYTLLDQIYSECKSDKDDFFLILEDDVIPTCDNNELLDIIKRIPNHTDILLLNTFDVLNKSLKTEFTHKQSMAVDPACAYLVKYSAIPTILENKLWFHHDFITFNNYKKLNIYKYQKNLFKTDYLISHNLNTDYYNNWLYKFLVYICTLFNIDNYIFFTLFKIIRIPIINIELTSFDVINLFIIVISFIIFLLFWWKKINLESLLSLDFDWLKKLLNWNFAV